MKFLKKYLAFTYLNKKFRLVIYLALSTLIIINFYAYYKEIWFILNQNFISSIVSGFIFSLILVLYINKSNKRDDYLSTSIQIECLIESELDKNLQSLLILEKKLLFKESFVRRNVFDTYAYDAISKTRFLEFINPEVTSTFFDIYSSFFRLNQYVSDIQSFSYGDKSDKIDSIHIKILIEKEILEEIK